MERGSKAWNGAFNPVLLSMHGRVAEVLEADGSSFFDLVNSYEPHYRERHLEFLLHT